MVPVREEETQVACYAGARYPERPRSFSYRGRRLNVAEVERRERTPDELRFLIRVADGRRFWLVYELRGDTWRVQPLPGTQQRGGSL